MRRMLVSVSVAVALAAAMMGVARAGEPSPTPTDEPELTQPTPSPIDPPAHGDDAASRLLLIGGVYEIVPGSGDCGWAETRRVRALYRDYETVDVVVLTSNCNPADDIYLFYPSSGELLRQRADTPRLRLQLVDGKVMIQSNGQPCSAWAETSRPRLDSVGLEGGEVAVLSSTDGCTDGFSFHYHPETGLLVVIAADAAAPTPTRTGVTLPNTGAGVADGLGGWVYVANGGVAALAIAGGLLVVARRRRE